MELNLKKNTVLSKIRILSSPSKKDSTVSDSNPPQNICQKLSKSRIAKLAGISRSSLYYKSSFEDKDLKLKEIIQRVLQDNPFYGHRRVTYHLRVFESMTINPKRIRRVMQKYDLRARFRRSNPSKRDVGLVDVKTLGISNLVKELVPSYPNHIWSSDFTYLNFHNIWIYVATIKDNFTKQILSWSVSYIHNTELVTEAYNKAVSIYGTPVYLHSDQGSEYRATAYLFRCKLAGI